MDPITILNLSLAALNGVLKLISTIKSQSGLTDDQILVAAQTQLGANADQLKQLLTNIPS